jgi:hypothetical protein
MSVTPSAEWAARKSVAILQSSYVPWKGYFDIMRAVDEFILYDDVQYTRRDWRNRNRLKSPQGVRWLTIPVQVKGRYHQRIDETLVADLEWAARHWATLVGWYGRAPCFARYRPVLEELYLDSDERRLSHINRRFLETLRDLLGITTPLRWSSEYAVAPEGPSAPAVERRSERLLAICRAAGATRYISGPAAEVYLDAPSFHAAGVEVGWVSYEGYPEYPQPYPPFEHHVSVLDLLLSVGDEAPAYMLGDTWTTSPS